MTEGSGALTSPDYPNAWEGGGNCSWVIIGASESDRVTLTLSHLDLHWWSSATEINCTRYYLAVHDGLDAEAPQRGKFCTNSVPPSITSSVTFQCIQIPNAVSSDNFSFREMLCTFVCKVLLINLQASGSGRCTPWKMQVKLNLELVKRTPPQMNVFSAFKLAVVT